MRYLPIDSRRSISLAAAIATILIIGAASAADAPAPAAPAVTALQCGHLIDTANGKLLGATTIVIEGGRIKEVSNGVQSPAGANASTTEPASAIAVLIVPDGAPLSTVDEPRS